MQVELERAVSYAERHRGLLGLGVHGIPTEKLSDVKIGSGKLTSNGDGTVSINWNNSCADWIPDAVRTFLTLGMSDHLHERADGWLKSGTI